MTGSIARAARALPMLGASWLTASAPVPVNSLLPNDNTQPAGTLRNGELHIALETRIGDWRPDGPGGRSIDTIAAFAEVGHSPTVPGPLIRVPVGTKVRGTLHNTLPVQLTVIGLGRTRDFRDTVVVAPGGTIAIAFDATVPGTYMYMARSHVDTMLGRAPTEQQLNGVIVIDPPHATPDRIMAITWNFDINRKSPDGIGSGVMAINGLSWPHTEHLAYTQGDSVHWRVVNLTDGDHPMHLHGFYFRVLSRSGDGIDTTYSRPAQRVAVTEMVNPFSAVTLAWQATRAGNWVFHCHYATHVSPIVTLDTHDGVFDSMMETHHPSDRPHQMYGLVMGITVAPRGPQPVAAAVSRRIRIEQREKDSVYGTHTGMSYVLTDNTADHSSDLKIPGPTLVLERGKRVEVTLVNQSKQRAAVHWHGIELESYADGVPGWSGDAHATYPSIAPHDSLVVRWTPPRAGSFMYHSHFAEARQMGGGLYGPIIVVAPGQHYDRKPIA